MTRILTLLAALLGVLSCAWLAYRMDRQPGPPEPLTEPPTAPFKDFVSGLGSVEADNGNVTINSRKDGIVYKIHVKVGDQVRTGDPLFELESDSVRALMNSRETELVVLEATIRIAEQKVNERRDIAERLQVLRAENVNSEVELVQARFQLTEAEAQLTRAKSELLLGKARLNEAKTALEQVVTRTPRDGEILEVNILEGEFTAPTLEGHCMIVGDTRRLQVRVDIDEDSASRISPAAQAVAQVRGVAGNPIPLQFKRIQPTLALKRNFTGGAKDRVDTRVLQVVYTFDRPASLPIYVGQLLDVFVDCGSHESHSAIEPSPSPTR